MAVLAVAQPTLAGVDLAPVAAAGGGDSFPNEGYTYLYVKNGGASPITVTIDSPGATGPTAGKTFDPDVEVTVAAAAEKMIGPFTDKARFNDANGRVAVAYSDVTTVTVKPIRVY